ncbi:MAG: glycosyltransferase [Acidobacteriaceae bacterium]|nr:glycosyltransferase [Acidobacteriaceae bacterium]
MKVVYLATIRHKYFDTIYHTAVSTAHLLLHRQQVLLYCNAANALFTIFPRLLRMPVALNVDGLERNRKKWNRVAKLWYLISEFLATVFPTAIVTDARAIQEYYERRYSKPSIFIPYGADTGEVTTMEVLRQLGLEPREYFLYVSRMEPENNALLVREAFERTRAPIRLALIGDAPYASEYIQQVRETNDRRVVMPGAIYGTGYHELQAHSFAYIHATEVGGTHPALIEAMGRGALVLYLQTIENDEVAGGVGIPFTHDNLAEKLEEVLAMTETQRQGYRELAVARVRERYSWDAVTDAYEKLLTKLVR